jgi:leucyl/phenylalanyl-tRNA---protein transferase
VIAFPDPRLIRGDIVALGDDLSSETLVTAYRSGIFPWPTEGIPLPWFSPRWRAILFFDELHIARSLRRFASRHPYRLTVDASFEQVITACAETPRPEQDGTWIYPPIIEAYCRLHELGVAHSIEVWEDELLVGGIYGVDAGGAFAAESMFHHRPNASKLALLALIRHLQSRGLEWLDIQVLTPHMEQLGARLISRNRFLDLLSATQARELTLFESLQARTDGQAPARAFTGRLIHDKS